MATGWPREHLIDTEQRLTVGGVLCLEELAHRFPTFAVGRTSPGVLELSLAEENLLWLEP